MCQNPGPEGACGECQPCRAWERGKSADYLQIDPIGPSRVIRVTAVTNDASERKQTKKDTEGNDADHPTPIRQFFRTMPLYSRHKVAALIDADRMNGPAANALLKTLEEPFPHAKLILTTTSVGTLLPTIRSRCLSVACALPPADALKVEHPEALPEDLILAEGAPGRLEEILRNPDPYRDLAALAKSLPNRRRAEALVLTERVRAIAERLEKVKGCNARAANAEALALLAAWVARDPAANPRWTAVLTDAHRRIVGNGNAGVVLDGAFAKMLRK